MIMLLMQSRLLLHVDSLHLLTIHHQSPASVFIRHGSNSHPQKMSDDLLGLGFDLDDGSGIGADPLAANNPFASPMPAQSASPWGPPGKRLILNLYYWV